MQLITIALCVTVLVPLASASKYYGACTTTSTACPEGSECVDEACIACEYDPRKCMRSVEKCRALKCAENEGCYLKDEADEKMGTITTTLVCAPKDPCADKTCPDDSYCENVVPGARAPVALCKPYNAYYPEPCDSKTCPDGSRCAVRRTLCGDHNDYIMESCEVETLCIGEKDCEDCDISYQFCEITGKDGVGKGQCADFKNRWD